jgi:DNA-binding transcriptional ArsR family regulator
VGDDDIAKDYALTRIGREPARAKIMERLSKEPMFSTNNEAAMNMFTCRCAFSLCSFEPMMTLRIRHETMLAFLSLLEQQYGGVEVYIKKYLDLTDEDISKIRSNLLASSQPRL